MGNLKKKLRLVSWNVNGIRACIKKEFLTWLTGEKPDLCCIQETKISEDQLTDEITSPGGYTSHWYSAEKRGYSGVGFYVKQSLKETAFTPGIGLKEFDNEGRVGIFTYGPLKVLNCYFPNSRHDHSRLDYKIAFNKALHKTADALAAEGHLVLICGDFNVAHKEIDLKNPGANTNNPGFLPEEREWMSQFLEKDYVDTFRYFYPDLADQYTWWSYRFGARAKNVGWRIDYFCAHRNTISFIKKAGILPGVMGSDHCPVWVELDLSSF